MSTIVENIINEMKGKTYIISNILNDEKLYTKVTDQLYDNFKQGFEIKELRECPVRFKFHKNDSETHTLQMRHLYSNLCMWYPFLAIGQGDIVDETYIIKPTDFTNNGRKTFLDNKFIKPFRHEINNRDLNLILHETQKRLAQVSKDFNPILGNSINIESYMDLYNRNAEFRNLVHTKINPNKQPKEVERELDRKTDEMEALLKREENCLKPILNCGGVVKMKQLAECFISFGYKPDIDGNTLPVPINANMLIGGLGNVTNLYTETNSSRKSLLANKYEMGDGGYFSILLMKLCSGVYITEDECNTLKPLKIEIKSKKHLQKLVGRYYNTDDDYRYRVLKDTDYHMVGKTIYVRTPVTCMAKNNGVCKKCYGELSRTNNGEFGIGAHAAAKLTEPLSQNILSTKHLLTTDSEEIKFISAFYKYLTVNTNEIVLNINMEYDISNLSLLIMKDDINIKNEMEVSDYNYFCTKFYVVNNKTGEKEIVESENQKELIIAPEVIQKVNYKMGQDIFIPFNKLEMSSYVAEDDSEEHVVRLFIMEIMNNELTKPLFDIRSLLNTKKDKKETLDSVNQRLLDLIIEANIDLPSVMSEIVLKQLVRDKKNILKRAKFNSYKTLNDYQILAVTSALEKNPSVLVSLSSQALGRQMSDVRTFIKEETSYLDPLFRV